MKTVKQTLLFIKRWFLRVTAVAVGTAFGLGLTTAWGFIEPAVRYVKVPVEVEVKAQPKPVHELIKQTALDSGIPALLLEAVVRHESNYRVDAIRYEAHHLGRAAKITNDQELQRMYASSIGLMQVMSWHAPHYGLKWYQLLDPETNLKVGADILATCIERHKTKKGREKIRLALGCFNGDADRYPPKVFAAMGEILAESL